MRPLLACAAGATALLGASATALTGARGAVRPPRRAMGCQPTSRTASPTAIHPGRTTRQHAPA